MCYSVANSKQKLCFLKEKSAAVRSPNLAELTVTIVSTEELRLYSSRSQKMRREAYSFIVSERPRTHRCSEEREGRHTQCTVILNARGLQHDSGSPSNVISQSISKHNLCHCVALRNIAHSAATRKDFRVE